MYHFSNKKLDIDGPNLILRSGFSLLAQSFFFAVLYGILFFNRNVTFPGGKRTSAGVPNSHYLVKCALYFQKLRSGHPGGAVGLKKDLIMLFDTVNTFKALLLLHLIHYY